MTEQRKPQVPEDVSRIIHLALDISYYRTVDNDNLGGSLAWTELQAAVNRMPEAGE